MKTDAIIWCISNHTGQQSDTARSQLAALLVALKSETDLSLRLGAEVSELKNAMDCLRNTAKAAEAKEQGQ